MRITKIRDLMATLFAILLLLALAAGIMLAIGYRVPFISDMLGK